jgi:hypothetical protein
MSTRKSLQQIIRLALAIWLLPGCASIATEPTIMPTPIAPPTAVAPVSANPGFITGRVHLAGPPTPPMVVYALDQATGLWTFTETQATDSEASFSLAVQPGSYQVFAAAAGSSSVGVGYSTDRLTLTTVAVAAGQTVSDIDVGPPGQSECGSTFGFPASPDGRFTEVASPAAECLAAILTPAAAPAQAQKNLDATRIQFQPNSTSLYTPGELAPNTSINFVLSAQKGQVMTAELTTEPDPGPGPSAAVTISSADGQIFTPDLTTKWRGVLPASQDYYIEVRSLSQQSINYNLLLAIPAVGSTPYVPVTLEVCQMLQEEATRALSITFTLASSVPFTDPLTGETGQGCSLTAMGTGLDFSDPSSVTTNLVKGFLGWTEQTTYQASGPNGAATAVTRDLGLVLIRAEWIAAPEVQCPPDQPISNCDIKPEQKLYTLQVQAAMK